MPIKSNPSHWPRSKGSRETSSRVIAALRIRGKNPVDVGRLARQLAKGRLTITRATLYKALRGGSAKSARGKLIREAVAKLTGESIARLFGPADREFDPRRR